MMCFKDSINGFASGNIRKGFCGGSDGKESAYNAGHTHTDTHTLTLTS